ncbi:MAG TPA: hypothetical protein VEX68_21505 [Bryobacteraceae bacterium]|nr:hypothetical protein [Bryobacteraceae bacterium]
MGSLIEEARRVMEGVYSHQTARILYELSDLNPAKLHLTVPPAFLSE